MAETRVFGEKPVPVQHSQEQNLHRPPWDRTQAYTVINWWLQKWVSQWQKIKFDRYIYYKNTEYFVSRDSTCPAWWK